MFSHLVSGIQGNCRLDVVTKGHQGPFGVPEQGILKGWQQVPAADTAGSHHHEVLLVFCFTDSLLCKFLEITNCTTGVPEVSIV